MGANISRMSVEETMLWFWAAIKFGDHPFTCQSRWTISKKKKNFIAPFFKCGADNSTIRAELLPRWKVMFPHTALEFSFCNPCFRVKFMYFPYRSVSRIFFGGQKELELLNLQPLAIIIFMCQGSLYLNYTLKGKSTS